MKYDRLSRRVFLTGVGGATLALPFLPSLLPRGIRPAAKAQEMGPAKRFIALKSYSTQNIIDFYPSTPVGSYRTRSYGGDMRGGGSGGKDDGTTILTQRLAEDSGRHSDGTRYTGSSAPLSDFSSVGVSRILGTEFNPLLQKMLLLRGLDFMPHINHNDAGLLGNFGVGLAPPPGTQVNVTIDQVMAHSDRFYARQPSGPRILHMSGGQANTFSFAPRDPTSILDTGAGAVDQVTAHLDPRTAFDEAFRGFMPPSMMPEPSEDPNERLVDRVIEDYRTVRDGPRLSEDDRQTLERHLTFLNELQARLDGFTGGGPTAACGTPTRPASSTVGDLRDVDVASIRRTYELFIDVAVAALVCDVTRVVTLDVFKAVGINAAGAEEGYFHSCDPCALSGPTNWHTHAHDWDNRTSRDIVVSLNQWIAREVVLPLVTRLDEVTESDGSTVLDNSVVLWGNELGFNHQDYTVPTVLFGSGGGFLETGRYIDYIDWNVNPRFVQHNGMVIEGVPYNRLLVTLMQAMGLTPADYEVSPGAGFGETRNLDKPAGSFATDYDRSTLGQVLPGIRA